MSEKQIWSNIARLLVVFILFIGISFIPPISQFGWLPFSAIPTYAATENFTTWVETDNSSDLTVTDSQITIDTMAANIESHVVRDMGTPYFDNFTHEFEINVQSGFSSGAGIGWWMVSEGEDTITEAEDANSGIMLKSTGVSETLRIIDLSTDDDHSFGGETGVMSVRITRIGTTVTCEYWNGSGYDGDPEETGTITCANTTFSHVVVSFSYDSDGVGTGSGYIKDLELYDDEPMVTANHTDVGTNNSTLNGMVYSVNDSNVTERGFEWGTSSGSYTSNWTEEGTWGEESFSHQATGLSPGAVYYRGMAKNDNNDWGYSQEDSFDTYEDTNPVVDNTTSPYAVRMPHEERIFYTKGLWWLFYGAEDSDDEEDPKIKYRTSSDNGTTWSAATTIRDGYYSEAYGNHGGAGFDIVLDSNGDFQYSYAQYSDLYYRKGTPDVGGSITWDFAESKIYDHPTNQAYHSSITANATSHPWITFQDISSTNVTSSSTNDGTWTDTGGTVLGTAEDFFTVPLTAGKMYTVYDDDPMVGKLYDGSSWGGAETLNIYMLGFPDSMCLIPDDDDIYMVSQNNTQHIFMKRTYGVGWGEPEIIADNSTAASSPVMCMLDNDAFLIVWAGGEYAGEDNKLYYRYGTSGNWTSITELQDETINLLNRHDDLTISWNEESQGIGLAYGTGAIQPYQVRFMHIDPATLGSATIPTVTTQSTSSIEEETAIGNGYLTSTGGENCDERGHQYDIDSGSPYSSNVTNSGSFGTGAFTSNFTGLTPGELYYNRAFAHNSVGYGFGSEVTFMSKPNGATDFTSGTATTSTIPLTWTNGTGMDYVEIRYSNSGYVSDNTSGTLGYWGNGSSTTIESLADNTTYYFSLYTHATDSGYWSIADDVGQTSEVTETAVSESETTEADYLGCILITNNGTSATNVSTNMTLNSTNLIASEYVDSNMDGVAMLTNGGADAIFMPGYDSNPWIIYVPSISANSTLNYSLYTTNSGSQNATKYYFPGATTGMTIADNPGMELGSSAFNIEISGYIDTNAGKALISKAASISLFANSGNISYTMYPSALTFSAEVSSGEHVINLIRTSSGSGNVTLTVDGVYAGSVSVGGNSHADNAFDWYYCIFPAITYMEYTSHNVTGTNVGFWEWNYGSYFDDQSANNANAVPTFYTSTSDAEVTAGLVCFEPINPAEAPDYTVEDAPDFITGNITATGNFTSTDLPTAAFPGAAVVEDVASESSTPEIWIWGILGIVTISMAGIGISYSRRKYAMSGGYVISIFIIALLIFGFLVTFGKFDWWMIWFYVITAAGLAVASRHIDLGGSTSAHGLIGFLATTWIGLTLINRILEGSLLTSSETSFLNTVAFTRTFEVMGLFTLPILNFSFFTEGIPSLLRWDYSFFGGQGQIIQYMLYSITAVVSFIIFGMILGLVYQYFSRLR